jgi:hypothetical protein
MSKTWPGWEVMTRRTPTGNDARGKSRFGKSGGSPKHFEVTFHSRFVRWRKINPTDGRPGLVPKCSKDVAKQIFDPNRKSLQPLDFHGAPVGTRTPNLLIRRLSVCFV